MNNYKNPALMNNYKNPTLTNVLRGILEDHKANPLSIHQIIAKVREIVLDVELVMVIDYHKVYRHLRTVAILESGFFVLRPSNLKKEVLV